MDKKIIEDLLNAGIGLFKTGKEGLSKAKSELEELYTELKEKGSKENSESIAKIRETVDTMVKEIQEFSDTAGKNYEETRNSLMENYHKISEELKKKIPEAKIESVKHKLDEIAEAIKKIKDKK